ncbi:hypothetical protein [Metasolibacillus sp.]|uniref:hypothetical protein n=1 Tax=Metasolibacillus sp. TaxID=2703680 RepID=UPI002600EC81|nr:hypothetical protein [Metasolibacillus sp.]MCT6925309.1 hypothetical protein [Metasolibacillus sp.]MCT6941461.1 hypothetical protein [Metasolibacillus sp.]
MPYLIHEEYKALSQNNIAPDAFPFFERKACDVLDSVTNDFYQHTDLEGDWDWRKSKFKKAVAAQIDYFYEMGATSSHGLQEVATVQIGRTMLSTGTSRSSAKAEKNSLLSEDVVVYLRNTGLLYQGVSTACW